MQRSIDLLTKWKVFGSIVRTPKGVKSVGYIWIFAQKENKNDEIVTYKVQLVGKCFSQNLVFICEKTYSLALDAITLQYLIILVAQ